MDITKVLKMIEEDDMYIPSDIAAFLSRPKTAEGVGVALIIPDWNNDKVTADYTRTLRSKVFKNCLDSGSKTNLTNTRFKLKVEDGKYYVAHRDLADLEGAGILADTEVSAGEVRDADGTGQ